MTGRNGPGRIRLGITILVAAVGLALIFGTTTLAGPSGVGKVLAQATTSTTSVGTTTVTTSGTTTTATTSRATTAVTSTGASSQVNAPSPTAAAPRPAASPAPGAPAPGAAASGAAPNAPTTGTGGLLNQDSAGSASTLWLSLIAVVVLAGGVGGFVFAKRR